VGFAAGIHLAAASRNFSLDQGTGYQVIAYDYVNRPFPIDERGGSVTVPTGPGLGVEPDRGKIAAKCKVVTTDAVFRAAPGGIPRLGQVLPPVPTRGGAR
jgi:hypothetical protein